MVVLGMAYLIIENQKSTVIFGQIEIEHAR